MKELNAALGEFMLRHFEDEGPEHILKCQCPACVLWKAVSATEYCPLEIPKPSERPPAGLYAVRCHGGSYAFLRRIDADGLVWDQNNQPFRDLHWSEYEWGPRLPDDWR